MYKVFCLRRYCFIKPDIDGDACRTIWYHAERIKVRSLEKLMFSSLRKGFELDKIDNRWMI